MTRFFERPQSSTLPILLLAGLFLGSCSSGGDGGGGASSTPPPSTSTPPPPVTQLVQQSYIKASSTGADDQFGYLIAFSGDTLVVGAPLEDSNANGVNGNQTNDNSTDSGAVYVFTRNAGVWTQQAYLKASNTNSGDQFGVSVAIDGDTLAVGATSESSNATGVNGDQTNHLAPDSGAVYVFTRTSGVWSQQAYIKASNTEAGDRFGHDIKINGETLAVGARFEASASSGVNANQTDNSAFNAGAAYVFTRTGGVWSQQAYIKASNAGANKNFSGSISIEGDTLAVGSRLEDSNATGIDGNQGNSNAPASGAVYLFKRNAGVWTQTHYLKASNANADDEFGDSVALSGGTLAVAAWFEASNAIGINGNQADNSASKSGAAYIFGEQ